MPHSSFVRAAVGLLFLFLLMLGLGVTVRLDRFRHHFKQPRGILIGLLCQFGAMPPLAYVLSSALKLRAIHRVALVITGCCPGGAMSNIVCFLARADLDLSLAMTTASSLGAIIAMPLNVLLYVRLTGLADDIKIDYIGIALSAVVVVCGLAGGVGTKMRVSTSGGSDQAIKAVALLGVVGGVGTMIGSMVANAQSDTPVWASEGQMYAAAFLQALLGLIIGFTMARVSGLPRPSCVAVSVETSVQNAILALAILALTFDGEEEAGQAAVVPMCYGSFTALLNLSWAYIAWKWCGFTEQDQSSSCWELMQAYKQSISIDPPEGLEMQRAGRGQAAETEPVEQQGGGS